MMYYVGLILLFFSFVCLISGIKYARKKDYATARIEEILMVLWLIAALICFK